MPVRRGLKTKAFIISFAVVGYAADAWSASSAGAGGGERSASGERQSLANALKALQAAGMNLVFTNSLVKPDYRVSVEPDPSAPLPEQASALLEPYGLALEQAGPDLWYVVRPERQTSVTARAPSRPDGPVVEELLVTSSRYRLVRDTHQRRRLDARELEVVPSIGRDLMRAVNQLPGQASVGVSARSHIRGGDSNEVLYLMDGVQIIEPFHMGDFHALFSTINPGLVDTINVYQAGFPAAFGTRLSGVVDMELTEPQRPLQGQVNLDFVNAATQAEGQSGNTRWLVSARRSTLDYTLNYLEQDYGHPKFHDELARLAWSGGDTDVVAGVLYGSDELSLKDSKAGESANADYSNLTTWARASHSFGDRLDVELAGSYTAIDSERRGFLDDPVDAMGSLEESREFSVASFRGSVRWRPSQRWLLHAGVEAQHQNGEFQVDMASRYGPLGTTLQPGDTLQRNVSADRQGDLTTAFLSAQQQLTDAVTVEYGARFDRQDMDPVHDHQFSPRVQVSYDGGGSWRAFFNVGRYAQHQNLYELQLDDGLLELNEPQLADQISVGSDWNVTDRWRLRLEAYWRTIDDPWARFENVYNRWVLLPELHADRVSLMPERARTYGGDVMVEYQPSETLRLSLSMAAARAEERIGGEWQPRPWEQRWTVRGNMDWRPGDWRFGVAAAYHSGWPTTSLVTQPLDDTGRLYDTSLPDYFSLDLHAARRFALPGSELEVYLDLSNATFADNVGGYRYELEDGAWSRDRRKLLPGVPVLGLSWSW